jgi:RNA methyltransferase, TrmH family
MLVKSQVKYIQSLGQKKFRNEEGLFIAEGPKVVKELMESGTIKLQQIYALHEWVDENSSLLKRQPETEIIIITQAELERISQLTTPNKVLAVAHQFDPVATIETKGKVLLALDTIQDPGNLGTLIRIADWFGISHIVCSEDCADVYNPKVVQSTMGSIARVRLSYLDLAEWLEENHDCRVYATVMDGQDISGMKKITEGIILIGNESKGIAPDILQHANVKITIPGKGSAESLNAAVAAGVVLSHLV